MGSGLLVGRRRRGEGEGGGEREGVRRIRNHPTRNQLHTHVRSDVPG